MSTIFHTTPDDMPRHVVVLPDVSVMLGELGELAASTTGGNALLLRLYQWNGVQMSWSVLIMHMHTLVSEVGVALWSDRNEMQKLRVLGGMMLAKLFGWDKSNHHVEAIRLYG